MKQYPLYTALTQLFELHGVELDEDTFETYAMSAYNKIGNKNYRMYRARLTPKRDCDGSLYIEKPCNLDSIESITLDYESAQETSTINNNIASINHNIEQDIENSLYHTSDMYMSGKFVKYREAPDKIYLFNSYPSVNLLYKGQYLDDTGLPFINDKELDAIVAYCVYAEDMKKARLTKDSGTLQMAQLEYQLWQKACSNARTPIELSQNQMNEILDVMTSWDRHAYKASSTKPIR